MIRIHRSFRITIKVQRNTFAPAQIPVKIAPKKGFMEFLSFPHPNVNGILKKIKTGSVSLGAKQFRLTLNI
jgi:hypothetical protein